MRTLPLRLRARERIGRELAERLDRHPEVDVVRYPGLPDHPTHATARGFMPGFGALVSFDVEAAPTAPTPSARSVRIIRHATSLGGVESTIERRAAVPGQTHLPPGLLRLSVGCENVEDLWSDLDSSPRSMSSRFRQVDVFGEASCTGNPVAVVLDADGLDDAALRRFAVWSNLSECTFVLPPTTAGADYRVRIFSLDNELPFAGHPTLGTARAWLDAGGIQRHRALSSRSAVRARSPCVSTATSWPSPRRRGYRSGPVDMDTLAAVTAILGIERRRSSTPNGSTTDPAGSASCSTAPTPSSSCARMRRRTQAGGISA